MGRAVRRSPRSGGTLLPDTFRGRLFVILTAFVATLIASASYYGLPQQLALQILRAAEPSTTNPPVLYQTRIVTSYPLLIHISNFVTPAERAYLLNYTTPLLNRSGTVKEDGTLEVESESRTSSTAFLPRDVDPVVENIRKRASEFQGYIPTEQIDLQVTYYEPGQYYRTHHDWFGSITRSSGSSPREGWDRVSTFFVILDSSCEKCGTQFPLIAVDWESPEWCEFLDCGEESVTTVNIPGAALYWRNLDETGMGRDDTLHAGLPAQNGTKVGLNIWTTAPVKWEWSGDE